MNLKNSLRTGLTICTLAGTLITARPTEAVMETNTEIYCDSRRRPLHHTVEGNQNLWNISRLYYGKVVERWSDGEIMFHYPTEIARANGIKTSDYIREGQRLLIPGRYRGNYCH